MGEDMAQASRPRGFSAILVADSVLWGIAVALAWTLIIAPLVLMAVMLVLAAVDVDLFHFLDRRGSPHRVGAVLRDRGCRRRVRHRGDPRPPARSTRTDGPVPPDRRRLRRRRRRGDLVGPADLRLGHAGGPRGREPPGRGQHPQHRRRPAGVQPRRARRRTVRRGAPDPVGGAADPGPSDEARSDPRPARSAWSRCSSCHSSIGPSGSSSCPTSASAASSSARCPS